MNSNSFCFAKYMKRKNQRKLKINQIAFIGAEILKSKKRPKRISEIATKFRHANDILVLYSLSILWGWNSQWTFSKLFQLHSAVDSANEVAIYMNGEKLKEVADAKGEAKYLIKQVSDTRLDQVLRWKADERARKAHSCLFTSSYWNSLISHPCCSSMWLITHNKDIIENNEQKLEKNEEEKK